MYVVIALRYGIFRSNNSLFLLLNETYLCLLQVNK